MFRLTTVLAGALAAVFTVAVLSAQDAPPEEYREAMGSIRAAAQAAGAETPDFAAIQAAANEARNAFMYVQTFWQERGDDEAAALAADGSRAAADLAVSAGLNSAEGVAFAAMEMGETCGACHMAHRVRLEDGSFAIQ